jgi:zinc protease
VTVPAAAERWVDHPSSQAHILIGTPALARNDPAFFPLFVGNHVLGGGGFVSWLMRELREQRGLTYGISSGFSPLFQPGPFMVSMQTRREQADEALAVVRRTLADFAREGPGPEALRAAQDNLIGSFALRLDTNREQLDLLAMMAWYGLPLDYLERWTERVAAVTPDQVRAAFAQVLDAQRLVTVVVGANKGSATHGATP